MRVRSLAASVVVALMMGAATDVRADGMHGAHAGHRVHTVHKTVVQAPVVQPSVETVQVSAPVATAYLPVATVIGAPFMAVAPVGVVAVPGITVAAVAPVSMIAPVSVIAPMVLGAPIAVQVAVTSAALLPPPSFTGHIAVTSELVPAALGSPLLLAPPPTLPQKQIDYCCGRI